MQDKSFFNNLLFIISIIYNMPKKAKPKKAGKNIQKQKQTVIVNVTKGGGKGKRGRASAPQQRQQIPQIIFQQPPQQPQQQFDDRPSHNRNVDDILGVVERASEMYERQRQREPVEQKAPTTTATDVGNILTGTASILKTGYDIYKRYTRGSREQRQEEKQAVNSISPRPIVPPRIPPRRPPPVRSPDSSVGQILNQPPREEKEREVKERPLSDDADLERRLIALNPPRREKPPLPPRRVKPPESDIIARVQPEEDKNDEVNRILGKAVYSSMVSNRSRGVQMKPPPTEEKQINYPLVEYQPPPRRQEPQEQKQRSRISSSLGRIREKVQGLLGNLTKTNEDLENRELSRTIENVIAKRQVVKPTPRGAKSAPSSKAPKTPKPKVSREKARGPSIPKVGGRKRKEPEYED